MKKISSSSWRRAGLCRSVTRAETSTTLRLGSCGQAERGVRATRRTNSIGPKCCRNRFLKACSDVLCASVSSPFRISTARPTGRENQRSAQSAASTTGNTALSTASRIKNYERAILRNRGSAIEIRRSSAWRITGNDVSAAEKQTTSFSLSITLTMMVLIIEPKSEHRVYIAGSSETTFLRPCRFSAGTVSGGKDSAASVRTKRQN